MNTILRVGACCLLLLLCDRLALSQEPVITDPCGDPALESQIWFPVAGRVIKVEDGDTVILSLAGKRQTRLHLIGIDAPERGKAFARPSRSLLESLVGGRVVEVWVRDVTEWRRRIPADIAGVVYLRSIEMLDVNLVMVQSGMARHKDSEMYSMSNHTECHYMRAEEDARAARRGLWRPAR